MNDLTKLDETMDELNEVMLTKVTSDEEVDWEKVIEKLEEAIQVMNG